MEKVGDTRAVVSGYLQTAKITQSERCWESASDAPGNENVRLRRIAVVPEQSDVGLPITVETPFRLEVEYWNLMPGAMLNVAIELYNIEEVCVFSTFSNPEHYRAGLLKAVCDVPGNLLNNSFPSI